jgi:hypothetical protein
MAIATFGDLVEALEESWTQFDRFQLGVEVTRVGRAQPSSWYIIIRNSWSCFLVQRKITSGLRQGEIR